MVKCYSLIYYIIRIILFNELSIKAGVYPHIRYVFVLLLLQMSLVLPSFIYLSNIRHHYFRKPIIYFMLISQFS